MFSVGLLVRIFIAPHAGFYGDLKWFQTWATRLAEVGPGRFYAHGRFADYLSPPHFLVSPAGASPAAGANSPAACVVSGSRS